MKRAIQAGKKQSRAARAEEAVFLELLRTTDMLSRGLVKVLKIEDLSGTQYNVLRILRGSLDGLPCGEIASRMITRDPDITRLLDRLEKRGLISRCRETPLTSNKFATFAHASSSTAPAIAIKMGNKMKRYPFAPKGARHNGATLMCVVPR